MYIEASTKLMNETLEELILGNVNSELDIALGQIGETLQLVCQLQKSETAQLRMCNHSYVYWWNLFGTKLEELKMVDCSSFICQVSSWKFPILYHRGVVLVFMSEAQYENKRKELLKNSDTNYYIRNMALCLNLQVPPYSPPLFKLNRRDEELDAIRKKVTKVLTSVYSKGNLVEGFALILFNKCGNTIASARIVVVDADLNICGQEISLNKYLGLNIPAIVDTVDESKMAINIVANSAVKLKKKAWERLSKKAEYPKLIETKKDKNIEN